VAKSDITGKMSLLNREQFPNMNRWVVNRGWGRTAVNFHDRSQLMGNNTGSSNDAMSSSDDSVSSSDDSVSSGDGSVSDHGVGGVRGNSGNVSNSGNDVGLLSVHGNMDGLVDGGGVRGDHSLGRVDVVGGVVDMGGLNNLLDGVNLVGGGNGDSTGNSDLVRGGHMLVHDDLTLDGNGNMDGDVNVVVLYIELGDDVGLLRGDPGVGPHGSKDLLLDNGVSGGGTSGNRRGRDGSHIGSSVGDDGRRQRAGLSQGLGGSSHVAGGGLGDDLLASWDMGVASDHAGVSGLDNLASDDSILGVLLNNGGTSSVGLVGLSGDNGGRGNGATVGNSGSVGHTGDLGGTGVAGVANGGDTVVEQLGCA